MRIAVVVVLVLLLGRCSNAAAAAAADNKAGNVTPPLTEEEKRKKDEEEKKREDNFNNWPNRDFGSATAVLAAVCAYIKDPKSSRNSEATYLEGKEIFGNGDVRAKLWDFSRIKIKSDGSDGRGWPAPWLERAAHGAVLVLFSSDLAHVVFIDKTVSRNTLLSAADSILNYTAQRRAARLAQAKAEAAAVKPPPPEEKKPELPGLDPKKPEKEKKKLPGNEPQDE